MAPHPFLTPGGIDPLRKMGIEGNKGSQGPISPPVAHFIAGRAHATEDLSPTLFSQTSFYGCFTSITVKKCGT